MTHSETIKLNKLTCTICELTVGEVLSFLHSLGDADFNDETIEQHLQAHQDNWLIRAEAFVTLRLKMQPIPLTRYFSLSAEEKARVNQLFFTVNKALFGDSVNESYSEYDGGIEARELYVTIIKNLNYLVMKGHQNALAYPFSYYLTLLEIK
jgi:hypothetical protein